MAKRGWARQVGTVVSSSYLLPSVRDPGAPAAFGGERLGPTGPAHVAPGPYWPLDPRVHLAGGSGASKKLQRRWPEPAPRSAHTHPVAASCLQRRDGLSLKVGLSRHPEAGPGPSLLTDLQFCVGLWSVPPGPARSSPNSQPQALPLCSLPTLVTVTVSLGGI